MAERKSSAEISVARIKSLPVRANRYDVAAGGGLVIRVSTTGRKVFRWQIRSLDKAVTIGEWSERAGPGLVTLAEALDWVRQLRAAHKDGKLSEVEAKLHPPPEPKLGGMTFGEVATEYVAHIRRLGWKSADEIERALNLDAIGFLGPKPVTAITAPEVRHVVKRVADRAPTQAARVFDYVKSVLRHAVGNGWIITNVCDALDPAALGCVERTSQRVLDDGEIVAFWCALDRAKLSATVRAGLRLLLLTGLRSGELLGATLDDLDVAGKTITVPVDRQKLKPQARANARPFVVPLSSQAMGQVERLRVLSEGSRYLLASPAAREDGEDAALSEKALIAGMRTLYAPKPARTGKAREPLLAFEGERPTPHDLRRTVRTGLARLGVPKEIAERVLNHKQEGIAGVYDTHDYLDERRSALDRWGAHVESLLANDKVISIVAVRK